MESGADMEWHTSSSKLVFDSPIQSEINEFVLYLAHQIEMFSSSDNGGDNFLYKFQQ